MFPSEPINIRQDKEKSDPQKGVLQKAFKLFL